MAVRSKSVNVSFFDLWSAESAYVLGYIWSDGCIRTERGTPSGLDFICTEEDSHILSDIAAAMKSTATVRVNPARSWIETKGKYAGRMYHSKSSVRLSVSSTVIAEKLIRDHGLAPRKSKADLPFPTNIPDHLFHHFARGVFDGDGSISVRTDHNRVTVYWLGTRLFIRGLVRQLRRLVDVRQPTFSEQGPHLYRVTWTAKNDVLALSKWLYADASLYLRRKHSKFQDAAAVLANVAAYKRRIS